MEKDPDGFREKEASGRQQRREEEMEDNYEDYRNKRAFEKKGERKTKMEEDPEGFREKEASGRQQRREEEMEKDPDGFREKEASGRQQRREEEMEDNCEDYRNKRAFEKKGERKTKMEEEPEGFREKEASGRQSRRKNELERDPIKFRLKEKTWKQNYRLTKVDSAFKRKKAFLASIRSGRIFFCICCHRKLHENQVVELDEDWEESLENQYPGAVTKFIGPIPDRNVFVPCQRGEEPRELISHFTCFTCKKYLERNKMAPMCHQNNLNFVNIDNHPELKLSELEQQLIALNLIFQKIVLLPKSRMNALKDRTVNVPISPTDVVETLTKLPRTPADARLAVVQLKRRLNYPGVHNQQLIDMRKVLQALRTFITMGNPHYQSIFEDDDFKQRCFDTDPEGYKILFPEDDVDLSGLEINSQKNLEIDLTDLQINSQKFSQDDMEDSKHNIKVEVEEEEAEYLQNDPIAKSQFNYNHSTCFGDNHPEIGVEENITDPIQVAPGQGKVPRSILLEQDFDVKSFPCLFPDGKNGKDQEREVTLKDQDYWVQRILNVDDRCGTCPPYVFAAAAHTELNQMNRNINLSFQKGLEKKRPDGSCVYTLDDPYMVLDNIKNTPRYWKKARQELYAKLENLGPFTFFFTLSCADVRWPENFTSLLEGHKVVFESIDGREEFFIDDKPLNDFLKNYPNKHEFVKNNLLNATANFQHRLRMFLKHVMLSKGTPLTLSNYNYRIEFQLRGAPHAHGTLWMDWKKFKMLPAEVVRSITQGLNLIKSGERLQGHHKESLVKFADLFVSVSLKDPATSSIVTEVNVHHHTKKACQKYGTKCRFNFPRFPTYRTIMSAPSNILYPDEKERKLKMTKHSILLDGVKDVLEDNDTMKIISGHCNDEIQQILAERTKKWRIEELITNGRYNNKTSVKLPDTLQQLFENDADNDGFISLEFLETKVVEYHFQEDKMNVLIKKRVEKLLTYIDQDKIDRKSSLIEQYEEALSVNKKGYSIHYRRDVDEVMVNTYNPEWISAWNGNMDFQLCLDYFAVITYISDYYCKDDSGTMKMLQEALKDSFNEDLKTRLKKMVSVFLTHRQMGESEAYYRIIPSMHMKDSNVKTVFAQTGFNPSRFLEKLDDGDIEHCEKIVEVEGRKGKYQEKPSLYDKYIRRDCKGQPYISRLCYAQFVKRYSAVSKIEDNFDFSPVIVEKCYDENGEVIHENHIITANYDNISEATLLPKYISINDLKPGELPYMKLRSPQVLRYHKFNREKNTHEYYYSELQLYFPHSRNKMDGPTLAQERESLETCQQTYQSSQLFKVKSKIMEFLESVEEGLEKAKELQNTIGDDLDPQTAQDKDECEAEGVQEHPDFLTLDPSNLPRESETNSRTGLFKTVTLVSKEQRFNLTSKLDADQRLVLSIVLNYARQIQIARKKPTQVKPPLLIVQGGAGAGKSLLINAIGQWVEDILRQAGDDPDKPYILITAFTGTAAANVDGMTLHSAFNFPFGNEFLSLGDKKRDEKRDYLKKLIMVIIDELSMIKADMLYQLDLRLRELMQNPDEPFGGCSLLLFGDILQLKPVMGRYIFQQPLCADYHLSHTVDPLWEKFQVLLLTHNHRQGKDHAYADILNRLRSGQQSEEDCAVLKQRVRKEGDKDLPYNALFIAGTNNIVNSINRDRLENMDGQLFKFEAYVSRSGKQVTRPPRLNRDGSIFNTPLQLHVQLKIGSPVMLTYNVDVLDSLANGAIGVVKGFETSDGQIKTILIQFKQEKVGREKRKNNSRYIQTKFPGMEVTPIAKIEFRFNLSKNASSQNDFMLATQFPLKLAFACTAHKIQGSTISDPDKAIVDLKSVKEAAQAYVMMSRVQSMDQIFFLDEFPSEKIYPSDAAMTELERLQELALNEKEKLRLQKTVIISLNIRSLVNHHDALVNDPQMKAKVIAIQETWCNQDHESHSFALEGYNLHMVNQGRGKGVATYFSNEFQVSGTVNKEYYQMSKVAGNEFDIVNIYCSQGANKAEFLRDLGKMAGSSRPCFIVGDFNINYLRVPQEMIVNKIQSCGYKQLVQHPTHIAGGLLDHVYVKRLSWDPEVYLNFPYYTDHAAISIVKP